MSKCLALARWHVMGLGLLCVLAAAPIPAPAPDSDTIRIGDPREKVIRLAGKPSATMKSGAREIYQYEAVSVTFRDGRVSEIDKDFMLKLNETRARQTFEAEQKAKGLVEFEGKWVTLAEKERIEKKRQKAATKGGSDKGGSDKSGSDKGGSDKPGGISGFFGSLFKGSGGGGGGGGSSSAVEIYKKYADLLAYDKLSEARPYATGAELDRTQGSAAAQQTKINLTSMGTIEDTTYKIQSQQEQDGGNKVVIKAVQNVARVPNGVAGPMGYGRDSYHFQQTVEMIKVNGVWKVSSLQEN